MAFSDGDSEITRKYADKRGSLSFILENDYFAGKDDGYTNGVLLSWLSSEENPPLWLERFFHAIPFTNWHGHKRYGVAVGQTMFTPDDLSRRDLIVEDQPYAGYLFSNLALISDTGKNLETFLFSLGVVGSASQADDVQRIVHKAKGVIIPEGWDHQLKNEPVLNLSYEKKWRHLVNISPYGIGFDGTPHIGCSVGNAYTHLALGSIFRVGRNLPIDYGPPLIRPNLPGSGFFLPSNILSYYLFLGLEGHVVGRNIFLDGNSFADSHHVKKKTLVGSLQGGVVLAYKRFRVGYTHILRTKEFYQDRHKPEFGAVIFSIRL